MALRDKVCDLLLTTSAPETVNPASDQCESAAGKEAAGRGIRVSTIHRADRRAPGDDRGRRDQEVAGRRGPPVRGTDPLARHATPEEIARSVLYLASADSSFVTGGTLAVDGGMTVRAEPVRRRARRRGRRFLRSAAGSRAPRRRVLVLTHD